MKGLLLISLLVSHLMKTTIGSSKSLMESCFGLELDEFMKALPEYTPEELQGYVVNSIKFLLNVAPDINRPIYTTHTWKNKFYSANDQTHQLHKVLVPLLDNDFKPLFVGRPNDLVPNFDLVELKTDTIQSGNGQQLRYLRPERIYRPVGRTPSQASWVYDTFHEFSDPEQVAIRSRIPLRGIVRHQGLYHQIIDQTVDDSFSNPVLKGLVFTDIYSPGYVGKGPRRLVSRPTLLDRAGGRSRRDWVHFLGYKQDPEAIRPTENDLLSRFTSSSEEGTKDASGQSHSLSDVDLSLHL